ncbi:hypothetical protein BBW65_03830 [Helicobacter enhydrae]|uniref:Outer membrane beta-barrel protein n=1 Tax=Helicobacter enhydrae TaxID=222136 RepID=A0A1B1U5E9_9HELI|nr:outer membrane beta-barrel protein [Helicobacter enhydrae]ANV97980.1 hypothetical protein BBW65_03830 [Helicobacter enhydrae]
MRILCVIAFFLAMLEARLYVGFEAGYSTQGIQTAEAPNNFSVSAITLNSLADSLENQSRGYTLNLVFGNEHIVANVFGSRIGVGVGYTQTHDQTDYRFVDLSLNGALMLDLYNDGNYSAGIFGGAEVGYQYVMREKPIATQSPHLLNLYGNTGFSFLIARHHRLDFVAKLPLSSVSFFDGKQMLIGGKRVFVRTSFLGSYKYVF